ncbi:MAG: TIGR01212 family radical SAM protein [Firmicutes bacterium]|nr:TIGR01212 family radical SAM protein [Bacillota bacterium]
MNIFGSIRYHSIGTYLKEQFGKRVVKLSLDGGFTCPNRDGSKGTGGCIFCSAAGSGDFAGSVPDQIRLLSRKWPDAVYIAYFQNFTNTYAPVERLRALWEEALSYPGVIGLAIATRPDCLPAEVLELLEEFNRKTFLWVELGLQTSNEETGKLINRCCTNEDFEAAMAALHQRSIRTVVHLILGLPGETREDMLASARYTASHRPFGIKLHMLHVMKGTPIAALYPDRCPLLSMKEYISVICDILQLLPQQITIHRLTGDAPKELLIAPDWTRNKHAVLNGIQQELKRRGTYQGSDLDFI